MQTSAAAAVPLALFLFACSSSGTSTAVTDAGAVTPTVDGGTVPTDAGATLGDAASVDSGQATGNVGGVFAISDSVIVGGGAKGSYRAGGFFVHQSGTDTTVTTKTIGPCLLEKIGDGTPQTETDLSAGALHIKGGKKTVDITPGAKKTYTAVTGTETLWTGGETLTLSADGADVPAFTTSLVAPSKLTMTGPALPTGTGALTVTRSAGLTATWTGASSGEVVLYFDAATGANAFSTTCTFPASAGTGAIPAAALADLPAIAGTFNFYVKTASTAAPTGWSVRFTASSAIVSPAGASATGDATFK